ncbi:MAG: UbiD family decarboxylase, partial [Chloroflexota bacterium]|nr:UbiD family decarboxylase [Chloroflexota bacterium]
MRDFIDACKRVDAWRQIDGADWNLEIGVLSEAAADLVRDPPMLMFDHIKDYPAGFRVVGLPLGGYKRAAVALGLPVDKSKIELVRMATHKLRDARPTPPKCVKDGPVMENVLTGDRIDLLRFPVPRYHTGDGGRYIGTGDFLINQDPESGFINAGTYRMQVHDRDVLGLWMSPGQHGQMIARRYWERGQACPVVAAFGGDPLNFMVTHTKIPWGQSELDLIGGLRGRPLEVIEGPVTGLPVPARAEIAIEGESPPPSVESRD